MAKERIPIPEETKRKLLVEVGHKCSIPGCNVKEDFMFHHINFDPSDNREENILVLCPNHAAMADKKKIQRKECELYKEKLKSGIDNSKQVKIKDIVETEGIDLEPENLFRKTTIGLGRKYLLWKYGKINHNLNNEIIWLTIIGLIFLLPIGYYLWMISNRIIPDQTFMTLSILSVISSVLAFGVINLIMNTKCKKCGMNFGIRRIESKQVNKKPISKTENYIKYEITERNTYECEYCKDKFIKNEQNYENVSK